MATSEDVAEWMRDEVNSRGRLYQEHAAAHVGVMFGDEFVCENENGNWVLAPRVRDAFRKLTRESVVWDRGEKCWRARRSAGEAGQSPD
jgi:hypothetical protein